MTKLALLLVFLGLSVMLLNSVAALSIQPQSLSLIVNSTNTFLFNLTNNENYSVVVKPAFYITQIQYPLFSGIYTNFSELKLLPSQSKQVKITFYTSEYVITIPNNVVNLTFIVNNKTESVPLYIEIFPKSSGGISISKIIAPSQVKPNSNLTISVLIDNTYNYPSIKMPLTISLLSSSGEILNLTRDITTYTVGENVFNFSLPIGLLMPSPYTIEISSQAFNTKASTAVYVIPYQNISSRVINKINPIWGVYEINYSNKGNSIVFLSSRNISGPFMLFSTGYFMIVNKSKMSFSTEVPLLPGKSIILGYGVSFVPIYLVIIVIVIIAILILRSNRYLTISKKLIEHKLTSSNILNARIQLLLKNVSGEELRDISVYDYLPEISEVKSIGPLEFQKIESSEGVKLKWKVGSLAPGEEAVLEYEFKTKTGVFGEMQLRNAEATFFVVSKSGRHKKLLRRSNKLLLEID